MNARTQITRDPELQRRARRKAAGVSRDAAERFWQVVRAGAVEVELVTAADFDAA